MTLEGENNSLKSQIAKLKGENDKLNIQVAQLEKKLKQKNQAFSFVFKDTKKEIAHLKEKMKISQKQIGNLTNTDYNELVSQFHKGFYACKGVVETTYPNLSWDFLQNSTRDTFAYHTTVPYLDATVGIQTQDLAWLKLKSD